MSVFEITREGHVATLWLANPARHNAMGLEFWRGLPEAMAGLDADESVRAVIVAARGRHFSVGLDLKGGMGAEFAAFLQGGLAATRHRLYRTIKELQQTFGCLAASPKPVLAAVHGFAIGGAVDLITACDLRYAVRDATLSVRETRIAMVADVGTLQRLPGIVGRANARELVFTGRDFSAEEGQAMGLFNAVFATQEAMMEFVCAKAAAIAANPPLAVQGAKRVLHRMEERIQEESLDYVALWNAAHLASEDLMEAMTAFMEKREAKFTGK